MNIRLALITALILLAIPVAYASMSCSVTTSCSQNEIFRISELTDGQAQLTGQTPTYSYIVCCNEASGSELLLRLSSQTNAHVQDPSVNTYSYSVGLDNADCAVITSGTCSGAGYETCVVSISDTTNAHVGDCSAYTNLVCCNTTSTCTDNDGDHYYVESSGCDGQPGFLGHNDCNDTNSAKFQLTGSINPSGMFELLPPYGPPFTGVVDQNSDEIIDDDDRRTDICVGYAIGLYNCTTGTCAYYSDPWGSTLPRTGDSIPEFTASGIITALALIAAISAILILRKKDD